MNRTKQSTQYRVHRVTTPSNEHTCMCFIQTLTAMSRICRQSASQLAVDRALLNGPSGLIDHTGTCGSSRVGPCFGEKPYIVKNQAKVLGRSICCSGEHDSGFAAAQQMYVWRAPVHMPCWAGQGSHQHQGIATKSQNDELALPMFARTSHVLAVTRLFVKREQLNTCHNSTIVNINIVNCTT
jgi:hypothetical protein